jgi:hypothetical protein
VPPPATISDPPTIAPHFKSVRREVRANPLCDGAVFDWTDAVSGVDEVVSCSDGVVSAADFSADSSDVEIDGPDDGSEREALFCCFLSLFAMGCSFPFFMVSSPF